MWFSLKHTLHITFFSSSRSFRFFFFFLNWLFLLILLPLIVVVSIHLLILVPIATVIRATGVLKTSTYFTDKSISIKFTLSSLARDCMFMIYVFFFINFNMQHLFMPCKAATNWLKEGVGGFTSIATWNPQYSATRPLANWKTLSVSSTCLLVAVRLS